MVSRLVLSLPNATIRLNYDVKDGQKLTRRNLLEISLAQSIQHLNFSPDECNDRLHFVALLRVEACNTLDVKRLLLVNIYSLK